VPDPPSQKFSSRNWPSLRQDLLAQWPPITMRKGMNMTFFTLDLFACQSTSSTPGKPSRCPERRFGDHSLGFLPLASNAVRRMVVPWPIKTIATLQDSRKFHNLVLRISLSGIRAKGFWRLSCNLLAQASRGIPITMFLNPDLSLSFHQSIDQGCSLVKLATWDTLKRLYNHISTSQIL
jgi:hypothetical protein